MKKLLFLLFAALGVVYVRKYWERIYDEWWEITHDRWYIVWLIAPWLKRLLTSPTLDIEPDTNEDDLLDISSFRKRIEGNGDAMDSEGS